MLVAISNSSPDPIYEQIARAIRSQILSGDLQPGDPLPSIRGLATQLHISVITTKRAYEELERDGFINAVAGKGCFVAEQNPELLREHTIRVVEEKLTEAIREARGGAIDLDQMQEMLRLLYDEDGQ